MTEDMKNFDDVKSERESFLENPVEVFTDEVSETAADAAEAMEEIAAGGEAVAEKPVIESEARLTVMQAIGIIVGHSIGSGILTVPWIAMRTAWYHVIWIVAVAYVVGVLMHLVIAELSYNSGGAQIVKSLERYMFKGKAKKYFSWIVFAMYGFAVVVQISGFISGIAEILVGWWPTFPVWSAKLLFYVLASLIVLVGMKAVGISEKYLVMILVGFVGAIGIGALCVPRGDWNALQVGNTSFVNIMALYGLTSFALMASQSVVQAVKGLNGNAKKIRFSIAAGIGVDAIVVLILTFAIMLTTTKVNVGDNEALLMFTVGVRDTIGTWAMILGGLFAMFAILTTFLSCTLNLRDIVHEQTKWDRRICYIAATLPSLAIAFIPKVSFMSLISMMVSVTSVLSGLMVLIAYGISRKQANGVSPIAGKAGTWPVLAVLILLSLVSTIGAGAIGFGWIK